MISSATSTMTAGAAKNPTSTDALGPVQIGPRALVTARWALVAVGLGLVVTNRFWPGLWGMVSFGGLGGQLLVLSVWALANLYVARRSGPSWARQRVGLHLLGDVAMLTGLLLLLGAASNPFSMLYFVPITLATLVSRFWTWTVALSAMVGFAALFGVSAWTMGDHGHGVHFWRHLIGMGIALGVAGSLVTYFVHRIASALSRERGEVESLRRAAREDHFVASLGALSAGAAHELGTPLGTIQLLVGELPLMSDAERAEALESIRGELDRCKGILHGMSNPELSAQALEVDTPWTVFEFNDQIEEQIGALQGARVTVRAPSDVGGVVCRQPQPVLLQTVRELVTNASRATEERGGERRIEVETKIVGERLVISVTDDGVGMDEVEQKAAFEPFSTTRSESRGLGLFLARVHVRQLGGRIAMQSDKGGGTVVTLSMPLMPPLEVRTCGGGRSHS